VNLAEFPRPARAPEPLVDAKAIAELLGLSVPHICKLALLKKIPAYPIPPRTGERSTWRFRMSEVEAWLAARKSGEARRSR